MTNDKKKRLTLFINPAIAKHARAQAVLEELSLTALVERALIKYLPKETVIKKADARIGIRVDPDP
jgi:hypothetical protein